MLETSFRLYLCAINHYLWFLCFSLSPQATDQELRPNEVEFGARGGNCYYSTFNNSKTIKIGQVGLGRRVFEVEWAALLSKCTEVILDNHVRKGWGLPCTEQSEWRVTR